MSSGDARASSFSLFFFRASSLSSTPALFVASLFVGHTLAWFQVVSDVDEAENVRGCVWFSLVS